MSEIPKAYEPQSVESKWYQFWLDQRCFVADPARVSEQRPAYSIVIPPPNVTGVLHMGHVLNNTIQDILARKARMDGKEVLWLPGMDHAGIATEGMVSKQLRKEEKKSKQDLGREEFIKRVWAWKEKHGGIIIQQLKKLGCSCDWTRERFTMDPDYVRCVQKVFVELYKKGLIYRGQRMVNWCPVSQTALSDEEVEMKPQKGFMYYFKVQVVESAGQASRRSQTSSEKDADRRDACPTDEGIRPTGTFLTIATTRPETIPGDTAVAVNPKDPRYAHLIGQHIVRPLPPELPRWQKLIPIVADEHIDPEFGTGVLKVTPAHDRADFEIGQRHKLPLRDIMNPDATMNALAGKDLAGLDRFAARKVAAEKLRELGALVEEKPYENNVGFSQRADVPIEPRLSEQWFLKYPSVDQSKACVEQPGSTGVPPASSTTQHAAGTTALPGQMRFHPDRWAKVYDHWLTNIQDWCISRQLWWGHRIPVWYQQPAWSALAKTTRLVQLTGQELSGKTVRDLRRAAWELATNSGFLRQKFLNYDTGWEIYVNRSSLEHGFANHGLANIKLVPGLPDLLHNAVLFETEPHVPAVPQFRCVHRFLGAVEISEQKFTVKFTVKERHDGRKLYDHQAVALKTSEADGESPGTHPLAGKLVTRPASASLLKIADLLADVNPHEQFLRAQIESPGPGWEQDPDVLDTWFSSWLWPFATMGWMGDKSQDSNNPTLQAFYPTADLVTAPEIIFFWVARMIMAGYEFMGDLPFRNVYFNGIVRDKQGRKMSKSLGNSPDPLDLIAKYGADAIRFGTMRSAPLGQDVLFDEKDVELGRNFCNKLWNACRFRQMVGGKDEGRMMNDEEGRVAEALSLIPHTSSFPIQGEIDPRLLTSDDKWILLKLDQAIREITTAFTEYKFNEATATLYRFFWSEYCDWYVEASKATLARPVEALKRENAEAASPSPLKGEKAGVRGESENLVSASPPPHPGPLLPTSQGGEREALERTSALENLTAARRANKLAVIDFVLSHTLRLFHPFLPHITEELWHGMGYAEDMPEDQGGKTIMNAPWPKPLGRDFRDHYGVDDCYLDSVNAKYDLVTQGRNLRRIGNIPASKKVRYIFKPANDVSPHDAEVIKLLLNAEALEIHSDYAPTKGTPTVRTEMGDLYLPLEGLIDVEAEKARLTKELEKIETEIAKVEQKLNNPNFTSKVPPQVLQEHQQRLADWQGKRNHAKAALEALEG